MKKMREDAYRHNVKQGEVMKERVRKKLKYDEMEIGSVVQIPVPNVDRGRLDMYTLTAVIVTKVLKDKHTYYKVATKHGLLDRCYLRNGLIEKP